MIQKSLERMQYNVFDTVMKIGKSFDGASVSEGRISNILADDIEKIRGYLGCTLTQTLLFCAAFAICREKDRTYDKEVMARMGIENTVDKWERVIKELSDKDFFVPYEEEFNILKYLEEFDKKFFKVNPSIVHSIEGNVRFEQIVRNEKSAFTLVEEFDETFLDNNRASSDSPKNLYSRTEHLENVNLQKDIRENLRKNLSIEERIFLYVLCWQQIHDERQPLHKNLEALYSNDFRTIKIKEHELADRNSSLLKLGYIKLKAKKSCEGKDVCAKVTKEGLKAVFGDETKFVEKNKVVPRKKKKRVNVITPSKIEQKELFFSGETQSQLSELFSALEQKNFSQIQKRLSERKFSKGVCCILYGAPGTGKTECVYQAAKATGRNIYKVDVGLIRARYVGQSERNTKKIFSEYKKFCKECRARNENIPILLLNEADGLFSKRLPAEGSNSTIQQMENTMQNIILEQMEKFEGIMIATTNLQDGFDEAFDRRFLLKVEFEKPTVESREKIWQSKTDSLSENELKRLAALYDFSGGEIDNIARKSVMRTIVTGKDATFDDISKLCQNERLHRTKDKVVGFCR